MKKTYVYHMLIGHNNKTELDFFMYARNATFALEYCKDLYREKKYNFYKAIKVGISHKERTTQIIPEEDAVKIRQAGADEIKKFSERQIDAPQFISKEEAGDLV